MKARTRTAVNAAVLLAVAAGAVAVAWFGVHLRSLDEDARTARGRKVLDLDPGLAREVRLSTAAGEISLVREGGTWRIAAPLRADADQDAVRRLLGALAALERRATSAKAGERGEALRAYGLEAPRTRIEVVLEGGRVERLALGDDNGFDGAMFVMPTSGEVVVVASGTRPELEPALDALRDRRVLRFEPGAVASVRIEGGGARIEVLRRRGAEGAPERWETIDPARSVPRAPPFTRLADTGKAQALVAALAGLEAVGFGGDDEGAARKAGLETPRRTYTVLDEGASPLARLLVGEERDGRVPVRSAASPQVYLVEPWRIERLARGEKDLEPPAAPAPVSAPAGPAPAPRTGVETGG
jgi:hypothetical protein